MCEAHVFFLKYWMCQAQVFFKCQMCQSPSVYMPYNALSDSFTEGSFIYSLPLHYINITLLTAFQPNFPIFAFYKMSKRQAYDVKLQTNLQIVKPAGNRPISSYINLTYNPLSKAFINLNLFFTQNSFPKLVIAQDNARFRIENIYSKF